MLPKITKVTVIHHDAELEEIDPNTISGEELLQKLMTFKNNADSYRIVADSIIHTEGDDFLCEISLTSKR